jgi:Concanavalin A-like lectin/glucanases superfamily
MLESFIKTYAPSSFDKSYKHTEMVSHGGVVIAFALDSSQQFWYTVLDLDNSEIHSPIDVNYWFKEPIPIHFPKELTQVGYSIAGNQTIPDPTEQVLSDGTIEIKPEKDKTLDEKFLASTARLTADAPFQVMSDGQFVYLFRQAIEANHARNVKVGDVPIVNNTLLVDRFVFIGNELKPKLEVRYQRSRSKDRPLNRKDSLSSQDLEGKPFYEPTQELDMVRNLVGGRFSVGILPTAIPNIRRWQIFAHNSSTGLIDSLNIERSKDGLFNPRGTQFYTCDTHPEVFESQPGKCPDCGSDLVPKATKEGFAESALKFNGTSTWIETNLSDLSGSALTVEFWFKGSKLQSVIAQQEGDRLIALGANGRYALSNDGGVGGGLAIDDRATNGEWHHLAMTWKQNAENGFVSYLDGRAIAQRQSANVPLPNMNAKVVIGALNGQAFTEGTIDEIRIWNRARSAAEIKADLNRRLVGNEEGLVAYWRFDEGAGKIVHDQTDNAYHGTIKGKANWVDSDAPVGDNPGVTRSSFEIDERTISGGLSALLYYQQENVKSGYSNQPKPLKKAARMMLAVATSKSGEDKNCIAALDFAVSREGKLALIPDTVALPALGNTGSTVSINDALDKRSFLEVEIGNLNRRIGDLNNLIDQLIADQEVCVQDIENLIYLIQIKQDFINQEQIFSMNLQNSQAALDEIANRQLIFYEHWGSGGTRSFSLGSEVSRGSNYFKSLNFWSDSANQWINDKASSISVPSGAQVRIFDGNSYTHWIQPGYYNLHDWGWGDRADGFEMKLTDSGCMEYARVQGEYDQACLNLQKVANLTSEVYLLSRDQVAKANELRRFQDRLLSYQVELNQKILEREEKQFELDAIRSNQLGEVKVPMELLHIDRFGLTISGGLLNFAYTNDSPTLFDSAIGKLGLYFRGAKNDQFFAAYFDTLTDRAVYTLPAESGKLVLTARSADAPMDQTTIVVENGSRDDTCKLTFSNPEIELTEIWQDLPREVNAFAGILNGNAIAPPNITGDRDTTAVTPISTNREAVADSNQPVYYDYSTVVLNQPDKSAAKGSLFFSLRIGSAHGAIQNTETPINISLVRTRVNDWVADSQGNTLYFDGKTALATKADTVQLDRFDTLTNITLETWVKPGTIGNNQLARLINHHSPRSCYSLSLKGASPGSALVFNGQNTCVETSVIDLSGSALTIEYWFKGRTLLSAVRQQEGGNYIVAPWNPPNSIHILSNDRGTDRGLILKPEVTDGKWHHVAMTWQQNTENGFISYVDGEIASQRTSGNTPIPKMNAKVFLGSYLGSSEFTDGALAEVRIWKVARTQAEIKNTMRRAIREPQSGLVGCWSLMNGDLNDYSGNKYHGVLRGTRGSTDYPLEAFVTVAGVGNQAVQTETPAFINEWTHIAAAFRQSFALQFDGQDDYLNAGQAEDLNLTQDLTIEAFVLPTELGQERGILTKGRLDDGGDQDIPYALSISPNGKLVFAFEKTDHRQEKCESDRALSPGQFYKVAVTRTQGTDKQENKVKKLIGGQEQEVTESVTVSQWQEIRFFINGQLAGSKRYAEVTPGTTDQPLEIGKAYRDGGSPTFFKGIIGEIRLWNTARSASDLGKAIKGSERGLAAWWRFEENAGNTAFDSKGNNHANRSGARWVKNPDPEGSSFTLYVDGVSQKTRADAALNYGNQNFTLGGYLWGNTPKELFKGSLEETRIWKSTRTQEEIQDNLFRRVLGDRKDLLAYYQYDADTEDRLPDCSGRANHLTVTNADWQISNAPVSYETPQVRSSLAGVHTAFHGQIHSRPAIQEYGDTQYNSDNELIGTMKRCYAYIKDGEWQLITGFKIGNIITEWIGQAQYDPQIIGFIEGAPPVPSENCTIDADEEYSGGSAVEIVEAESVQYTLSASKESTLDTAFKMAASVGGGTGTYTVVAPLGAGIAQEVTELDFAAKLEGSMETSNGWSNESSVSSGKNLSKNTKVKAVGSWEADGHILNPAIGKRFVFNNTGFALVQSDTADIFALRMEHNNVLISFRFQPNPDIPKDWNLVPFQMNPRYVCQGTLDGRVGMDDNGNVYDPNYQNARDYGEYSYFKPKEAYALKNRIRRDEEELKTYYENFSTSPLDADRAGKGAAIGAGVGAALAGPLGAAAGAAVGGLIGGVTGDKRLPQKLAKRNLVNTYVWTAEGGFFAETTELADSMSETVGGSFSFKGAATGGFGMDIEIFGVGVGLEMEASIGGSLNLTKSKTRDSESSFSLNVELEVPDNIQKYQDGTPMYDAKGQPVLQPGKVDAYRFMTFYLEPSVQNFDTFVNKVVDPIWLAESKHPNAAAIRSAIKGQQKAKKDTEKSIPWRVMHRVTFVSRVLPEISTDKMPQTPEETLKAADIDSNYELIKRLEPFVSDKVNDYVQFTDAVRNTIEAYMPELKPAKDYIVEYMCQYYQVFD